jgi:hypothetical protein
MPFGANMKNSHITRRTFALSAAAAATGALIPAHALAHARHAPPQPSDAMSKLSPESRAEVEMRVAAIIRKYGSKLSDEQKVDIRRILAEGQEGLEKMRAYALANSDQPATVFRTLREREGK